MTTEAKPRPSGITISEETITIPRHLWQDMASVIREAVSRWYDEDGNIVADYLNPTDWITYSVPVPVDAVKEAELSPADQLLNWFSRKHGTYFRSLYDAVYILNCDLTQDPDLRALVSIRAPGEEHE